jgi:hypothetical protein
VLHLHSQLDPAQLKTSPGFFSAFPPFEPSIPDQLAPRTLAYLGLGDPEASIQRLLDQAQTQAPALVAGFDDFAKRLEKAGGVSIQDDVLPLLGGQAAFTIQPPAAPPAGSGKGGKESETGGKTQPPPAAPTTTTAPGTPPPSAVAPPPGLPQPSGVSAITGPPYLTFIGDNVDPGTANAALAKLQGPLAQAFANGGAEAPAFSDSEVDGVAVHSLSVSPAVDLTYATFNGQLVVSTQPDGISRVTGGPGGLAHAALYTRTTDGFPSEPVLIVYLNLHELLGLAESAGLAEISAYAPFAQDATKLAGAAVAVARGEASLDTSVSLHLSQSGD